MRRLAKETKLEAGDGLSGRTSWHHGYLRDILRNGDAPTRRSAYIHTHTIAHEPMSQT